MSPGPDIGTDPVRCRLDLMCDFTMGLALAAATVGCLVLLLLISARHGVASSVFRYVGF